MPLFHNYVVDAILVPAAFVIFLVFGILGIGLGVGLIVFRDRVIRLVGPVNRWVSVGKNLHSMEASHDIEPFVRRHPRWFSGLFIIGGTFSIFVLAVKVNVAAVASAFSAGGFSVIGPWIIQSLVTFLVIGSVVAIVIGIVLGLLPHLLGAIEKRTDRWISSPQMGKGIDDVHLPLDRWFQSSPRTAGCILAIASLVPTLYAVIVLTSRR